MRQGNIAQRTQALRPGAQICICSFVPTRIFGLLKCASDLLFQETCLVITGCRCIHCWQKLGTWIPWLHKKWSLSGFLDQTLHNHDIYVFYSKVELASTPEVVAKRAALTSWSALMKNKYKHKFIALALYLLFQKCTILKYI